MKPDWAEKNKQEYGVQIIELKKIIERQVLGNGNSDEFTSDMYSSNFSSASSSFGVLSDISLNILEHGLQVYDFLSIPLTRLADTNSLLTVPQSGHLISPIV